VYRRLTALLREAGCRFERQGKGSHEVWSSPITRRTFAISQHSQSGTGERDPQTSRAAEGILRPEIRRRELQDLLPKLSPSHRLRIAR